jgi:hypothetical protein
MFSLGLMKRVVFFCCGMLVVLSSCVNTKPLTSAVLPEEVRDIQKFETISKITFIEQGNQGDFNERMSAEAKGIFTDLLTSYKEIPIAGKISVTDTVLQNQLEKEIQFLCSVAAIRRSIKELKITPLLDSLLETGGHRFGLLTITTGFTRSKANYRAQVLEGAATGLLTLGMYSQTPIRASSSVYAMIVDAQDENIAFFKVSYLQDEEPLEREVYKGHIIKIFQGYFLPKE